MALPWRDRTGGAGPDGAEHARAEVHRARNWQAPDRPAARSRPAAGFAVAGFDRYQGHQTLGLVRHFFGSHAASPQCRGGPPDCGHVATDPLVTRVLLHRPGGGHCYLRSLHLAGRGAACGDVDPHIADFSRPGVSLCSAQRCGGHPGADRCVGQTLAGVFKSERC